MSQQQKIPDWLLPVFIAGCAGLLFTETCVVAGKPVPLPALTAVFLSALLAYSLSKIRIRLHVASRESSLITGPREHIAIVISCLLLLLPVSFYMELHQLLWLVISAVFSFLYMIPVYLNKSPVSGLRSIFLIKNILLSLVWAITTVIIPAGYDWTELTAPGVMWIMARRFLFIYCLATLYDIPDTASDLKARVDTIPARLGSRKANFLAFITLLLFLIFTLLDPFLPGSITLALTASAFYTCAIMFLPAKHPVRYKLLVDSAMALRAGLVMLAA
jgi:4-hydroxybenzoate polyprenyltransferase